MVFKRFLNAVAGARRPPDRKSTRLNSSHSQISYAVFCLKKKHHAARPVTIRCNGAADRLTPDVHGRTHQHIANAPELALVPDTSRVPECVQASLGRPPRR